MPSLNFENKIPSLDSILAWISQRISIIRVEFVKELQEMRTNLSSLLGFSTINQAVEKIVERVTALYHQYSEIIRDPLLWISKIFSNIF